MPTKRQRISLVGFVFISLLGSRLPANDDASSADEHVAAIDTEWEAEMRKCFAVAATAKTQEEKQKALAMLPDEAAYSRRMLAIAEPIPNDPRARQALLWIVQHQRGGNRVYSAPMVDIEQRVLHILLEHYANDPQFARIAYQSPVLSQSRELLLERMIERADNRETQGVARLALGRLLMKKIDAANVLNPPGVLNASEDVKVEKYRTYIRSTDVATTRRKVESLLQQVVAQFGDVPLAREDESQSRRTRKLGQAAESLLDEIRNLAVGSTAPEIEGVDLDGKPLKLSNYRGKVVVLVFWASWCDPCIAAMPNERELVERLKDRQFAPLGINVDKDQEAARKVIETQKVNWQNWNDPFTAEDAGPIADKFHVRAFPSTFVLDAKGIIRAKNQPTEKMHKLVDKLLKEFDSSEAK